MSRIQERCSVTLHQQDGGLTMQAFANREGLTLKQAMTAARRGQILGARQDGRSKRWWVYPPAKLLSRPRSCAKRGDGFDVGTSPHGLSAGLPLPHQETPEALSLCPPAKPVLTLEAAALPAARSLRARPPASSGKPDVYAEARSVCQALHDAAVRQYREGVHYLRLNAHELAQLYAALNSDRSRVRKLVGKGLLPVGLLRASDSVWQKMQAMCREGRLL